MSVDDAVAALMTHISVAVEAMSCAALKRYRFDDLCWGTGSGIAGTRHVLFANGRKVAEVRLEQTDEYTLSVVSEWDCDNDLA